MKTVWDYDITKYLLLIQIVYLLYSYLRLLYYIYFKETEIKNNLSLLKRFCSILYIQVKKHKTLVSLSYAFFQMHLFISSKATL